MFLPGETVEEMEKEEKVWSLLSPWVNSDQIELVRHRAYTFRSLLAKKWSDGRVMIAGDAAHQMPPFFGQGLNSGMRDAWGLAWRLGLMLDGKADLRLLDTYLHERSPHVGALIGMSMFLGKVICISDPQEAAGRDAAFGAGDVPPFPPFPMPTAGLLRAGEDEALSMALRRAESIGRPLGDGAFMAHIEALLGRDAKAGQRGPKPRQS